MNIIRLWLMSKKLKYGSIVTTLTEMRAKDIDNMTLTEQIQAVYMEDQAAILRRVNNPKPEVTEEDPPADEPNGGQYV